MASSSANNNERSRKRFGRLEKRLGYTFNDHGDLERALTHTSVRRGTDSNFHYERLEFLGDRVLGLAISDMLHRKYPAASEGELSLRLNALVKGETLARISDMLRLHEFIRTGGDLKEITGKRMQSVRADVLEALIASIYLDGGLDAAKTFVHRFWESRLNDEGLARRDSKTELQEWTHARRLGTPRYVEQAREGPDHDPQFTIVVKVKDLEDAIGEGRSKRAAEQAAARNFLKREGVLKEEGA